jgi:co-chaperonin GroES (HSP10)
MSQNPSGILPTEYKVLIEPRSVGDKIGSVFVPDVTKERDQVAQTEGVIVDMSAAAFTYEQWPKGTRLPRPGDRVLYAKYAGSEVRSPRNGKTYRLVNDKDIAAVLEA